MLGLRVAFVMQQEGRLLTGSAILTTLLLIGGMLSGMMGIVLHSLQHFVRRDDDDVQHALHKHTQELRHEIQKRDAEQARDRKVA